MTPERAEERMLVIAKHAKHDQEEAGVEAIGFILELLRKTGYYRVSEIFERMLK